MDARDAGEGPDRDATDGSVDAGDRDRSERDGSDPDEAGGDAASVAAGDAAAGTGGGVVAPGRVVGVALVWLLVVFAAAVALVASGLVPAALSVGTTVSLLVGGGLLLAAVSLFVGYFASGRLFRGVRVPGRGPGAVRVAVSPPVLRHSNSAPWRSARSVYAPEE